MASVETEVLSTRELSGMESFMAGMSATINAVVTGRGELNEKALREALRLLRNRYPIAGGKVVDTESGFAVEVAETSQPTLMVLHDDPEQPLHDDDLLVANGNALTVRVTIQKDQFRVVLSCLHSLADGRVMVTYLMELFSFYTQVLTAGYATAGPPHALPQSPETVLSERGIEKLSFEEFVRQSFGSDAAELYTEAMSSAVPSKSEEDEEGQYASNALGEHKFAVAHDRLLLSEQTTRSLLALGKKTDISVHGLVSAAAILAELYLDNSPEFLILQVRSAVDVRLRVTPVVADPMSVTNLSGNSTTLVLANAGDDPLSWARQVRDQIAVDIERGIMPQSLLQMSDLARIMKELSAAVSRPIPDTVFLTNMGVIPPIMVPEGMVIDDVHGVIHSDPTTGQFDVKAQEAMGYARNHSYLVSTFQGRLSMDLFQFGSYGEDTHSIIQALTKAFDTILSE